MPPRRGKATASKGESSRAGASAGKRKKSKAAKGLGLTEEEEAEVREVFDQYAGEEDEDVMPTSKLREALKVLGFDVPREEMREYREAVDPENSGFFGYSEFLELCALKFDSRTKDDEVDRAYELFAGQDGTEPITLERLKQLAVALKEDVTDEQLQAMMDIASGGKGEVDREDFMKVMERAGVF